MIVDSPYAAGETILSAKQGALVGLLVSSGMLLLLEALAPWSGLSAVGFLESLGTTAARGAVVHHLVGLALGFLYAGSQLQASPRAIVTVGVFYGLVTWIVGSQLASLCWDLALKPMLHSWAWLLCHLFFGLSLAGVAIQVQKKQPSQVLPKD